MATSGEVLQTRYEVGDRLLWSLAGPGHLFIRGLQHTFRDVCLQERVDHMRPTSGLFSSWAAAGCPSVGAVENPAPKGGRNGVGATDPGQKDPECFWAVFTPP